MKAPGGREGLPFLVVPDSGGKLEGSLHGIRRSEYFRDAVVLVSKRTPNGYLDYLKERGYRHHVLGREKVDLEKALHLLRNEYGAGTVLADTGQVLGNLLIEKDLASEMSLLVHPVIVGRGGYPLFGPGMSRTKMDLKESETMTGGLVWMLFGMRGGP